MAAACVHVMELEVGLRLAYNDFLKKEHSWIIRIILLSHKLAYHWKVFFPLSLDIVIMDKLLINKAMKMPPIQRVALAELLLASIDYEEGDIREAWISEVNERMKAVNEGRSTLLDFDALYREA